MLPSEFERLLREAVGESDARTVIDHLDDEPMVSVRVNPSKMDVSALREHFGQLAGDAVEWEPDAFYLKERPSFTTDPLFQAGAYYVQEASSMYVGALARIVFAAKGTSEGLRVLDLCAAPGGKTTHLLSLLDGRSLLVTNEVIRQRATILAENVAKWGSAAVVVTSQDPSAFAALESEFDLIVIDAPCSGEGMFRKDEEALRQWSPDKVTLCTRRQRRILSDIWGSLRPGGFAIYSTCTFNRLENEDNARFAAESLGAELLEERRFLPGRDRGEGFYCALLRKNENDSARSQRAERGREKAVAAELPKSASQIGALLRDGYSLSVRGDLVKAFPTELSAAIKRISSQAHVISSGVAVATIKGSAFIPEADLALSPALRPDAFPRCELTLEDALKYLRREPIILQDEPMGYILLTYKGMPLGFVKNLGRRTNSLLPLSRRILTM